MYTCHLKNMKDVSRCEMMADLSTQYIITDERWLKYLPPVISGGFCFRPLQVWKVMYPSFERCHALDFSGNSCCSVNSRHLRKDCVNAFKGFLHMFGSKSPRTYRVRPFKLVCEPIKYSYISRPPKTQVKRVVRQLTVAIYGASPCTPRKFSVAVENSPFS